MDRDSSSDIGARQSRRRFLATTGATTAGAVAAPLLISAAQAAPLALQPASMVVLGSKNQDLQNETSTDAGQALTSNHGLQVKVLSPRLGAIPSPAGDIAIDALIVTMPSVVFDAVHVPGGAASGAALKSSGDAVHFVREAFKHAKAISAAKEGASFLATAGIMAADARDLPAGVSVGDGAALITKFLSDVSVHRHWSRDSKAMAA